MNEWVNKKYREDPEYRRQTIAKSCEWQRQNRERKAEYDFARREAKSKQLNAYDRNRSQLTKRVANARSGSRKRKMAVNQRSPSWLTDNDRDCIASLYQLAVIYSQHFKEPYHVDHIYPLRGKVVSGLHVPANLQVLPAIINMEKHNNLP